MNTQDKHNVLLEASQTITVEPIGFFAKNIGRFSTTDTNPAQPTARARVLGGSFEAVAKAHTYSYNTPRVCLHDIEHDWQLSEQIAHAMQQVVSAAQFYVENELMTRYASVCDRTFVCSSRIPFTQSVSESLVPDQAINWDALDYNYGIYRDILPKDGHGLPTDAEGRPVLTLVGGYDSFHPLKNEDAAARSSGSGVYSGWKFETTNFGIHLNHDSCSGFSREFPMCVNERGEWDISRKYDQAQINDLIVFHPEVLLASESIDRWHMQWVPEKDGDGNLTQFGFWRVSCEYTPKLMHPQFGTVIRALRVVDAVESTCDMVRPDLDYQQRQVSIAKELYTAYCEAAGWKSFNGDPLPVWEAISKKSTIKDNWLAAADRAIRLLDAPASTDFAWALRQAISGKRIRRAGWNGKKMFVYVNKGSVESLPARETTIEGIPDSLFELGDDGTVTRLPNLNMRAATGSTVTGWLASQTDLLASDWEVVPDSE